MSRKAVKNFLEKLKAMDSVPEEVVDAACEMADEAIEDEKEEEVKDEEVKEKVEDECGKDEETVEEKIEKAVSDAVSRALLKAGIVKDEAMESLEALDEELKSEEEEEDAEGEESVTVDPKEIKSEDSLRKQLIEVKPYIASIKDSNVRKKIADSFAKIARLNRTTTSEYGFIQNAVVNNKKAADESLPVVDDYDVGKSIAGKFNPHYMKEE